MIIVKLMGGLGNQMFQYACGRSLSIRHNTTLKVDTSFLSDRTFIPNFTFRDYELGCFNAKITIATEQDLKRAGILPTKNLLKKLFYSFSQYQNITDSNNFAIQTNFTSNSYLNGYWQSEKYFSSISHLLRKDFTFQTTPSVNNENLINQICKNETASIHIRRGDFINNKVINAVHGICSLNYYYTAIDKILEQVPDAIFFIFSDDSEWVKANFKPSVPFVIVDINDADKNYEDLRLMSNCKHNIIANSSFSWWGAWLNNNPNKIVIAPKQWYQDNSRNTDDLIPESWIRM